MGRWEDDVLVLWVVMWMGVRGRWWCGGRYLGESCDHSGRAGADLSVGRSDLMEWETTQ